MYMKSGCKFLNGAGSSKMKINKSRETGGSNSFGETNEVFYVVYLAMLGTRVRGFPFSSTQSIVGGGSPLAKQSRTMPVVFENRTRG